MKESTDRKEDALQQGSEDWKRARWCAVTGACSHSVATNGAKASKTLLQKIYGEEKAFETADTTRGHRDETMAIAALETQYNFAVQRRGFVRHESKKWIGYSPDGETVLDGSNVLIECKSVRATQKNPTPKGEWSVADLKFKKKAWYDQVQHGMMVTGAKMSWLCVVTRPQKGEPEMTVNEIPQDAHWWPSVSENYEKFHAAWLQWAWEGDAEKGTHALNAFDKLKQLSTTKRKREPKAKGKSASKKMRTEDVENKVTLGSERFPLQGSQVHNLTRGSGERDQGVVAMEST